jgi:hypothetical protein
MKTNGEDDVMSTLLIIKKIEDNSCRKLVSITKFLISLDRF